VKPAVGFNWRNGRLVSVTVTFPRLYDGKPLRELAEAVRVAVGKEFRQTPESIALAFTLDRLQCTIRPGDLAVTVHHRCASLTAGTIRS
jgi:hypothetical protein